MRLEELRDTRGTRVGKEDNGRTEGRTPGRRGANETLTAPEADISEARKKDGRQDHRRKRGRHRGSRVPVSDEIIGFSWVGMPYL